MPLFPQRVIVLHKFTPFALLIALLMIAGCQSDDYAGRIPISTTTPAEAHSAKILPTALIEFSDQVPRKIVEDLNNLPIISKTKGPVTVLLGSMVNKTGIVSTREFQMAANRLRSKLINSNIAREKLHFVMSRSRMQQLAAREHVASQGDTAEPEDYDPNTTYVLLGKFFRIARGNTNQYYMQFQLVHFGTNQIVFSNSYMVKQVTGK